MKTQITFKNLKEYLTPNEFIEKYNIDVKLNTFIYRLKKNQDILEDKGIAEFKKTGKQIRIHIIDDGKLFGLLKND